MEMKGTQLCPVFKEYGGDCLVCLGWGVILLPFSQPLMARSITPIDSLRDSKKRKKNNLWTSIVGSTSQF